MERGIEKGYNAQGLNLVSVNYDRGYYLTEKNF